MSAPQAPLYTLDLRTHAMSHLSVADQAQRKKEHDMRALKRQTVEDLRQGAAKGRKVLYIWDRAGIDFRQWFDWKRGSGIYFLSRAKDNMDLEVCGKIPFDAMAPVNQGVLADQIVGTCAGVTLRRVSYKDVQTGVIYHYLTNLPVSIPPGVIALLYKARWDVEKVFDEFKNKLVETKAWASSANAKTVQARMLCLTHNLMTLMEELICQRFGVRNEAEFKRREKREVKKSIPESSARIGVQRLTQRTVKFIRWLKNHIDLPCRWDDALARLNQVYSRL